MEKKRKTISIVLSTDITFQKALDIAKEAEIYFKEKHKLEIIAVYTKEIFNNRESHHLKKIEKVRKNEKHV